MGYHLGILFQAFLTIFLSFILSCELQGVARKPARDKATGAVYFEVAYWVITTFYMLPKSILNYTTLQLSGIYEHDYPLLYAIVYTYHT